MKILTASFNIPAFSVLHLNKPKSIHGPKVHLFDSLSISSTAIITVQAVKNFPSAYQCWGVHTDQVAWFLLTKCNVQAPRPPPMSTSESFLFLPGLALLMPLTVAVFKTISQSFSASANFCIQPVDGCCSPLAMTSWLMILKTVHLPLFEPFEKLTPECYLSWPQQHLLGIPPQSFWAHHGKP